MKEIVSRASVRDTGARVGLDVYLHRLRAEIAAMSAALGGLDVLIFTGGVGENSPAVRQRAADGLRFLGVDVDPIGNQAADGECEITCAGAAVRTFVIPSREDLEIARQVRDALD